jgi:hypothetical protein
MTNFFDLCHIFKHKMHPWHHSKKAPLLDFNLFRMLFGVIFILSYFGWFSGVFWGLPHFLEDFGNKAVLLHHQRSGLVLAKLGWLAWPGHSEAGWAWLGWAGV